MKTSFLITPLIVCLFTAFASMAQVNVASSTKDDINTETELAVTTVEEYAPNKKGKEVSALIRLPGSAEYRELTYIDFDGVAVFEGDIILSEKHFHNPGASVIASDTDFMWPNGTIPYTIDAAFSGIQKDLIRSAIDELNAETNLNIIPRNGQVNYVHFKLGQGCASELGLQGGRQHILLSPNCTKGNTMHEILHAAGFRHEQTRSDRDKYIEILWDNIKASKKSNFKKHEKTTTDLGTYDLGSIMHYGVNAFGKKDKNGNTKPTIKVLSKHGIKKFSIGQRTALSTLDKDNVNRMYPANQTSFSPGDTRVIATVSKIKALSADECGSDMDFYGSVEIGDNWYWKPGNGDVKEVYDVYLGKNELNINWTVVDYVPPGNPLVQVIIEVKDMDTRPEGLSYRGSDPKINPDCGGDDDKVDINPAKGMSRLKALVDISNNKIYSATKDLTIGAYLGEVGNNITVSGDKSSADVEKAELTFRVDVD